MNPKPVFYEPKTFSVSIFVLMCQYCVSQTETVFRDDFNDDDHKGWIEGEKSKIADGHYLLKNDTEGSHYFNFPIDYDPYEPFYLEVKLKLTGGVDNYGFGLYLSDNRISKKEIVNHFCITGNGNYRVFYTKDDTYTITKPWTIEKALKTGVDNYNFLAVSGDGKEVSFYVNDKKVYTQTAPYFWGDRVGFILYNKTEIAVDYIFIKQDDRQIHLAENKFKDHNRENLGTGINTEYSDVAPVISTDGKTLYYMSKNSAENKGGEKDDIWVSEKQSDGNWGPRKNVGSPLNNEHNNMVISISPDNNNLIVFGKYSDLGYGVYNSTQNEDGWSVPEKMVIEGYYNRNDYVEFCLSADRNVLIIATEPDDGFGRRDLHVSFLTENGTWTTPKNMGRDINTFANDYAPFLAADGKTLYFTSAGHPGYGGTDIFVSKRLTNSWTKWSKPVNLGSIINTNSGEAYFSVPASGEWAYTSSMTDSYGKDDLVRFKLPKELQPDPVVLIYGTIIDSVTAKPVKAKLSFNDYTTGKEIGFANSSPRNGSYIVSLPAGQSYSLEVKKDGYKSKGVDFDVDKLKEYKEFNQNFELVKGKDKKKKDKDPEPTDENTRKKVKREMVVF